MPTAESLSEIKSLLEDARKQLLETGTRNRLIHVNRKLKRGNVLNIINERSDDIFQILRLGGKKMRFIGKGTEEGPDESYGVTFSNIEDDDFHEGRYTDSFLETPLTPDALQKRLLKLSRYARTAEEEQGINVLYLAMGFLQWYEDENSNTLRESPLILVPVSLVRNKSATYDIVCRDDDIATNLSLQERLKDFKISLPEIDDSTDWTPSEYFMQVRETIPDDTRWKIDFDGMQLGFFSFAKLMMLKDLDPANWNAQSILSNKLIVGLLLNDFPSEPPLFQKGDKLDEKLSPDRILHVVNADSSQTQVIEEVRSGKNLVVQGPPGTGKSETITNILAAAAYDNKKVLFVAEKMAALEVVYKRMRLVDLGDLCLELHSKNATKKIFLQALDKTISNSTETEVSGLDVAELRKTRDELNKISDLLHTPLPQRDYTPFEALSEFISFSNKNLKAPRFDASKLEPISSVDKSELIENLKAYLKLVGEHGFEKDNPFYGSTNLDLQTTDLQRLVDEDPVARLDEWIEYQKGLEKAIIPEPLLTLASASRCRAVYKKLQKAPNSSQVYIPIVHENLNSVRFEDALKCAIAWITYKTDMSQAMSESVWRRDFTHLREPIAKGTESLLYRIFGKYRSASKELEFYLKGDLPQFPEDRLKLLDEIIEGKSRKVLFDEENKFLAAQFGEGWRGEKTPFDEIQKVLHWLQNASRELGEFTSEKLKGLIDLESTQPFNSQDFDSRKNKLLEVLKKVNSRLGLPDLDADRLENLPLLDLKNRILLITENTDMYKIWTETQFLRNKLRSPCGDLLKMIEDGEVKVESAITELKYALSEVRWKHAIAQTPGLRELEHRDRHKLVTTFQDLDEQHIRKVKEIIKERHLSQVPKGSAGEMGIIRGEIGKKRNHRPIRKLMGGTAEIIQRIKPIFFMSPISVAQFLPPGKVEFDLLVIDEASQVKPADALGSVARAKQIVVVGDQKQLPPTTFFDRLTDDDDSTEDEDGDKISAVKATEMESILSLCEARTMNERMLQWHYRSRDPSLIKVSNDEFYDNRLILPPCPTESDDAYGLKLTQVPGVYSSESRGSGRPKTNQIEAESIAARLKELAISRNDFSVGIVTFSKPQADMVTEVLELRRREDGILDHFLREDKTESVFVKNIENVQGDERDIILISVGYGPREPGGKFSMNFGPINSEGGERRLNVLFTRSRIACEVFTSFDPEEIHFSRTSKKGLRVLKKFLKFAQTGELARNDVSQGGADSLFEEDVAEEIRRLGYEVDHQVGTAGFKIDLGVRCPINSDHHILAVECDGAAYHSALSARERDRTRQEVLEGFGWHFHRIWSTDWFARNEREVQRLETVLEEARMRDPTRFLKGSNRNAPASSSNTPDQTVDSTPIVLEKPAIKVPLYKKADIKVSQHYEPHKRPLHEVIDILYEIVEVEGPVHIKEIVKRYAAAHDKSRAGARISNHVSTALAERNQKLESKEDFWGTSDQFSQVPVRDRSKESIPTTSAESISCMEILACVDLIEKESGNVDEEELIRVIAKTLGFKRAGPDLQSRVRGCLKRRRTG